MFGGNNLFKICQQPAASHARDKTISAVQQVNHLNARTCSLQIREKLFHCLLSLASDSMVKCQVSKSLPRQGICQGQQQLPQAGKLTSKVRRVPRQSSLGPARFFSKASATSGRSHHAALVKAVWPSMLGSSKPIVGAVGIDPFSCHCLFVCHCPMQRFSPVAVSLQKHLRTPERNDMFRTEGVFTHRSVEDRCQAVRIFGCGRCSMCHGSSCKPKQGKRFSNLTKSDAAMCGACMRTIMLAGT